MKTSAVVLAAAVITAAQAGAVEEAKFKIIVRDDAFEIRDYAPQILAETIVEGTIEEAGDAAFRRLFRYISGENSATNKIAMTAPVSQEKAGEKIAMTAPVSQQAAGEKWAVSFMMPQTYTMQTIPRPTSDKIRLREIPARRVAAVRYSGFWSGKRYKAHLKLLREWIAKKGVTPDGDPVWARYNPPFTPWFLRRNEVLIPLKEKPFNPAFFIFQNGLGFGPPDEEAKVIRDLGYEGVSQVMQTGAPLASLIETHERQGSRVLSVYLNIEDEPITEDLIRPLANRNALIEMTVRKMTPRTAEALRQTAETAARLNIRVALYPHHGFAVATLPQAAELIGKVNHPNLGVMFNLCHFLKNEDPATLETALLSAGDRLFAVSTSGADMGATEWNGLIKTLDSGDFPQKRLFEALRKQGFAGPVSLQCFSVKGDKRMNLEKSIKAWKEILESL